MHGVVGVLVHIDWVAGCLLEGSVQACLQVGDHIQEVGYFDVDLGGNIQVVLRYILYIDSKYSYKSIYTFVTL